MIAYFNNAHKQLALLRSHQREIYGKNYALTLAGKTRWGTQVNSLTHLRRSKQAIQAYRADPTYECNNREMKVNIDSYDFWTGVDELIDVLNPIHEAQIASESSKGRLDYVATR
jgi:hypothetical protein